MKQGTAKMPIQPRIDHDQGSNLLIKLLSNLFGSKSPLLGEWKSTKHGDGKRCQNSTAFIRKIRAKKKRLRKISYQSRRS